MKNRVIFIMGVSGVGKSTIGELLAEELKLPFFDGDDYHPNVNIVKMSSGKPLNDIDRHDWLVVLNDLAKKQLETNSCIIVCSALKQRYRDLLSDRIEHQTKWVHLSGSYEQIFKRIGGRSNHFMPAELLKSQFDSLENPKKALQIDSTLTPEDIVKTIKNVLL